MSPPTHECVVETGISAHEASSSHIATAPTTQRLPYISVAESMYPFEKHE